jgi:hypothetical protein
MANEGSGPMAVASAGYAQGKRSGDTHRRWSLEQGTVQTMECPIRVRPGEEWIRRLINDNPKVMVMPSIEAVATLLQTQELINIKKGGGLTCSKCGDHLPLIVGEETVPDCRQCVECNIRYLCYSCFTQHHRDCTQEAFLCEPYRTRIMFEMEIGEDWMQDWFRRRERWERHRSQASQAPISSTQILADWLRERRRRASLCTFCQKGQSCRRHPFIPK